MINLIIKCIAVRRLYKSLISYRTGSILYVFTSALRGMVVKYLNPQLLAAIVDFFITHIQFLLWDDRVRSPKRP